MRVPGQYILFAPGWSWIEYWPWQFVSLAG
jgi:hypothetical protein